MPGVGGWLCLELGDSLSILLKVFCLPLSPQPSRTPFPGSSGRGPYSLLLPTSPGRQAVLGMVRKAKYRELLLSELLGRRAPASVRLGLAYHVHDLIGAQLVDW